MTLTSILGHLGHQGGLWGSKSKFDPRRGYFAPNQKVQKTKYVLICPINTPPPLVSQNFEIDTLLPPSIVIPLLDFATQSSKIETGKLGSTSSNAISSLKGPHFQSGREKSNLSEQKL